MRCTPTPPCRRASARAPWPPWAGPFISDPGALELDDLPGPAERSWGGEEERALRLWIALARCYTTFSRAVAQKVSEYGLTAAQFGILEAIHHLGPLSLGELADKLLVTGGNVTYIMDRLEEQGLVRRVRSGADRRVVVAALTPEGRGIIEDVFPGHAAYIRDLAGVLEPGEQDELRRLLKKLGTSVGEEAGG